MCVVVFDPAAFKASYPEFSAVTDPVLVRHFNTATLLLNNTDCSPVADCVQRSGLFDLIVAHLASLGAKAAAGAPVGNITSATEGSVSVSFDAGSYPMSAAYWKQSQYGLMYWMSTAAYRTARYIPGRSFPAPQQFIGARRPWPL